MGFVFTSSTDFVFASLSTGFGGGGPRARGRAFLARDGAEGRSAAVCDADASNAEGPILFGVDAITGFFLELEHLLVLNLLKEQVLVLLLQAPVEAPGNISYNKIYLGSENSRRQK